MKSKQEEASKSFKQKVPLSAEGTSFDAFGASEWGLVIAPALIWGSSFFFIEIGLRAFSPGVIAMARIALGALTLVLFTKARQPVEREDLPQMALLGVTWMGIPMILFPTAQQWVDSSMAGMIDGAVPITTAAWSVFFLRKWPGRLQLAGIGIGFIGIVAISWPGLQQSHSSALGVGLIILAVILYGFATCIAVPLQQRYGSLPVLLRAQLFALVIVVPYGLWQLPQSTWAWSSAAAMIPLGMLGTAIAMVLITKLVGRVGATRGAISSYFIPIVAILLGVFILGEKVSAIAIGGMALVLIGAWLASRGEPQDDD